MQQLYLFSYLQRFPTVCMLSFGGDTGLVTRGHSYGFMTTSQIRWKPFGAPRPGGTAIATDKSSQENVRRAGVSVSWDVHKGIFFGPP